MLVACFMNIFVKMICHFCACRSLSSITSVYKRFLLIIKVLDEAFDRGLLIVVAPFFIHFFLFVQRKFLNKLLISWKYLQRQILKEILENKEESS
jgi:hypothetical protein